MDHKPADAAQRLLLAGCVNAALSYPAPREPFPEQSRGAAAQLVDRLERRAKSASRAGRTLLFSDAEADLLLSAVEWCLALNDDEISTLLGVDRADLEELREGGWRAEPGSVVDGVRELAKAILCDLGVPVQVDADFPPTITVDTPSGWRIDIAFVDLAVVMIGDLFRLEVPFDELDGLDTVRTTVEAIARSGAYAYRRGGGVTSGVGGPPRPAKAEFASGHGFEVAGWLDPADRPDAPSIQ